MADAHDYLKAHDVEAKVAAAVTRVLRERPVDPLVAISQGLLSQGLLYTTATAVELREYKRRLTAELDEAIAEKEIGDKTSYEFRDEFKSLAELPPEELASHAGRIAQGLAYVGPSGSIDYKVREEAVKLLDKLSDEAVLQHAGAFTKSLFETRDSNVRDTAVAARLMRLTSELARHVPELIRHRSHDKELARQVASAIGKNVTPEVVARRISSSDGDTIFLALSRDASHAELLGQVVKIDPSIAERVVQSGERKGERYADYVGSKKCNEAIKAALYHELLIFACSPKGVKAVTAEKEAEEVASLFPTGAVETKVGGTANNLRQMLQNKPVRRFLFAGHGNAPSPGDPASGRFTLGFTSKDGKS